MASRLFEAMVPVVYHAEIRCIDRETDAAVSSGEGFHDLGSVVGRAIVGDEQFEIAKVLREHGFNRFADEACVIVRRNEDADRG